jgi:hypothetical protein
VVARLGRRRDGVEHTVRRGAALVVLLILLMAGPAARADVDWGADAFSVSRDIVDEAEAEMGTTFESYSIYSNLDRSKAMDSKKTHHAMDEGALIYLNINSELIGQKGHIVPICWTAIAAGNRDSYLEAWAQAILATRYTNLLITFNHEAMWTSPSQPKCSKRYDNPETYKAAFNHVRELFIADGIDAPWAYVMTWGATKWEGGLLYRPPLENFDVIGTDQYYRCDNENYRPSSAFKSFFEWTAANAPGKPALVGEIGALSTCPFKSLTWLNAAKSRLEAHDVVAIDWNLRTDATKEYNPLLDDDIKQWWMDWMHEATGTG